jgi:hypothetical protein
VMREDALSMIKEEEEDDDDGKPKARNPLS